MVREGLRTPGRRPQLPDTGPSGGDAVLLGASLNSCLWEANICLWDAKFRLRHAHTLSMTVRTAVRATNQRRLLV